MRSFVSWIGGRGSRRWQRRAQRSRPVRDPIPPGPHL